MGRPVGSKNKRPAPSRVAFLNALKGAILAKPTITNSELAQITGRHINTVATYAKLIREKYGIPKPKTPRNRKPA